MILWNVLDLILAIWLFLEWSGTLHKLQKPPYIALNI